MNDKKEKTVLITGASKGIGRATAEKLVKKGYRVIGTCREPERLKEEDKVQGVLYKRLDLSDEESIKRLLSEIPTVDVLINNAGSSLMGPLEELSQDTIKKLFQINLFGHSIVMQGVLPGMRMQKKGLIINVTSFASRTPVPFSAVYASAKAAMETLSFALNSETRQFGVFVTAVAPVFVKTNIYQEKSCSKESDYYPYYKKVSDMRDAGINNGDSPDIIAKKIVKIMELKKPKMFYAVGRNSRFLHLASRLLPKDVVMKNIRRKFGIDK